MSSTYTGVPGNVVPATPFAITIPSDGDAASAASVNSPGPFEPTADKVAWLDEMLALNAALNVQAAAHPAGFSSACSTGLTGGVQWVTVGGSGAIYTSAGPAVLSSTWSTRTSHISTNLNDVASSGSLIVAVGGASVGVSGITTSPDGVTWTARTNPGTNDLFGVCWSSSLGLWCAVGSTGQVLTSPDGVTWTARSAGGALTFTNVAFGAGVFVALAAGGTGYYTSPDGVTWTSHTLPSAPPAVGPVTPRQLIFANGLFVYGAAAGALYTSPDGLAWTSRGVPAGTTPLVAIVWNGKLFRASASANAFATSFDGITWARRYGVTAAPDTDSSAAAHPDGRMLVGTQSTTTNYVSQTWQTP